MMLRSVAVCMFIGVSATAEATPILFTNAASFNASIVDRHVTTFSTDPCPGPNAVPPPWPVNPDPCTLIVDGLTITATVHNFGGGIPLRPDLQIGPPGWLGSATIPRDADDFTIDFSAGAFGIDVFTNGRGQLLRFAVTEHGGAVSLFELAFPSNFGFFGVSSSLGLQRVAIYSVFMEAPTPSCPFGQCISNFDIANAITGTPMSSPPVGVPDSAPPFWLIGGMLLWLRARQSQD